MSLQDKQIKKLDLLKKTVEENPALAEKIDVEKLTKSIEDKKEKLNNEKPVDK